MALSVGLIRSEGWRTLRPSCEPSRIWRANFAFFNMESSRWQRIDALLGPALELEPAARQQFARINMQRVGYFFCLAFALTIEGRLICCEHINLPTT